MEFRTILTDWMSPPSDVWAVFPTGRMISPKVHASAHFVETELRRSRWKRGLRSCIPDENNGYDRIATSGIRVAG